MLFSIASVAWVINVLHVVVKLFMLFSLFWILVGRQDWFRLRSVVGVFLLFQVVFSLCNWFQSKLVLFVSICFKLFCIVKKIGLDCFVTPMCINKFLLLHVVSSGFSFCVVLQVELFVCTVSKLFSFISCWFRLIYAVSRCFRFGWLCCGVA